MRFFARIYNLVRGSLGRWISRRERRNPEAVVRVCVQERTEQYATLRSAAAGVLYSAQQLTKELEQTSKELARVRGQLTIAVDGTTMPSRSR